ncbi:unnamed protein product [Linum tenue]|uniref:Uncharacterized protein n=1 Tax=Linum tenue TaxID=586396 RepID=A0AAV0HQ36_9ROSI|nr:unnamed protein product [Linum tenue]
MLAIDLNRMPIHLGKQMNRPSDRPPIPHEKIVMPKHDPTRSQQPVRPVQIGPNRGKLMTRVDLDQIRGHTPLAQHRQGRTGGERERKDRVGHVGINRVLHELIQQRHGAVDLLNKGELLPEPGPTPEVVDAQNDRVVEAELTRQLGHVDGRRAEKCPDFDDDLGADLLEEVAEHGRGGAPAFEALVAEGPGHVRRREVGERGGAAVDAVDEGLSDLAGG